MKLSISFKILELLNFTPAFRFNGEHENKTMSGDFFPPVSLVYLILQHFFPVFPLISFNFSVFE